jgi:hypothetical protein
MTTRPSKAHITNITVSLVVMVPWLVISGTKLNRSRSSSPNYNNKLGFVITYTYLNRVKV